ncbi:MAG: HAD-IB family phosphatase [Thermoplasmata archaeon]|nr:HAD-IB family phosphatase [Thermoplasmata archaeon]
MGLMLADELHARELMGEWEPYCANQKLFKRDSGVPYDEAIRRQSAQYARCVRGLEESVVREVALSLSEKIDYSKGFDGFYEHCRRTGARLVLITASPDVALAPILERYAFDSVAALTLHTRDGRFTGTCGPPMDAETKKGYVSTALSEGASFSCGIGDTASDVVAFTDLSLRIQITRPGGPSSHADSHGVEDFHGARELFERATER